MADQQDQSLSGGSVEKASASADTSKLQGKGSSSGANSSYRKRHNNYPVQNNFEEKRRKCIIGEQPLQTQTYKHTRAVEFSRGESRSRNERRNERSNGTGLECLFGNNLKVIFYSKN